MCVFAVRTSFVLVLGRVLLVLCRIILVFSLVVLCYIRVVSCCLVLLLVKFSSLDRLFLLITYLSL